MDFEKVSNLRFDSAKILWHIGHPETVETDLETSSCRFLHQQHLWGPHQNHLQVFPTHPLSLALFESA